MKYVLFFKINFFITKIMNIYKKQENNPEVQSSKGNDLDSPNFPANKHLNTFTNQQNPIILRLKCLLYNFCL